MEANYPRHVVAAGMLVRRDRLVLLVRTPRRGWEFPGGQIELGESIVDGVAREVLEEAKVEARAERLVGVYSNLTDSRVMLDFVGSWVAGEGAAGDETTDVAWVTEDEARARVENPLYRRRLEQMLAFEGGVLYQTYTKAPYTITSEQLM